VLNLGEKDYSISLTQAPPFVNILTKLRALSVFGNKDSEKVIENLFKLS